MNRLFYKHEKNRVLLIMIDWKLIGDLFICFSILGGGILFIRANVNYIPEDVEREEDERR